MSRIVLVLSIALANCGASVCAAKEEDNAHFAKISPQVTEFLHNHCVMCHGPDEQNAELRFDTMPTAIADEAIAQRWQDILDVLNLSQMPPEDAEQPSKADLADMLETLTSDLRMARQRLTDSGGHIVLRRLNRREYQSTIETLFGVPVDVSMLPEDGQCGCHTFFGALRPTTSFTSWLPRENFATRRCLPRKLTP